MQSRGGAATLRWGGLSASQWPLFLQVSEKAPALPAQPAKKASTDLLADIGGDPFAAPPPRPAFSAFGGESLWRGLERGPSSWGWGSPY